jgi:hypothetical protein
VLTLPSLEISGDYRQRRIRGEVADGTLEEDQSVGRVVFATAVLGDGHLDSAHCGFLNMGDHKSSRRRTGLAHRQRDEIGVVLRDLASVGSNLSVQCLRPAGVKYSEAGRCLRSHLVRALG